MNDKQQAEIGFWSQLVRSLGKERFIAQRKADLDENSQAYMGKFETKGKVLEVGSGLFSQLEWCDGEIFAVDPLMDHYKGLLTQFSIPQENVTLITTHDEKLPFHDAEFDYVVCWNVIDHTPDQVLLLSEIKRVLKPGGIFYFEVHFDDHLAAPHYGLWNKETVETHFKDWKKIFENCFRNPSYPQSKYYAIFERTA